MYVLYVFDVARTRARKNVVCMTDNMVKPGRPFFVFSRNGALRLRSRRVKEHRRPDYRKYTEHRVGSSKVVFCDRPVERTGLSFGYYLNLRYLPLS